MTDELDPGLRRLFASTAEAPADETFVSAVTARTARERRLVVLGRALAGVAIVAALFAAMTTGLLTALDQGVGEITALVSTSPIGLALGLALAFAGVVCVRALAPVVRRRP